MALDKRLELGGLQIGGPRTSQIRARFRKANNVYQTPDGYYIPRGSASGGETVLNTITPVLRNVFRYRDLPFVLGYDGGYKAIYNAAEIPGPSLPSDSGSLGVQTVEKLGNLYLNFPFYGLYKYDGYNCYRAGSPLPYYEIPATYLSSPTFYTRVVQSHMDMNGNIVHSGYYESQTNVVSSKIQIRTDRGATTASGQVRPSIEKASSANGYNAYFICGTTYTANGDNTITVNTAGDHFVEPGIRLIADSNAFQRILLTVSSIPVNAVSYEVISFGASSVVIGNMKYLDDNGDWQSWDYINGNYYPGNPTNLCHYFMTVWTSDVSTGVYYLQKIVPALYESNVNHTFDVNIASVTASPFGTTTALNLGPVMSETYDVFSAKQVFPVTSTYQPLTFTTYQDLCLIGYSNEVYYSDTSAGGSFEMTEGLAFALVGEGDDGNVQAICGNSDFLVVSRKYRNYYVSGNLPTGNYRVSEIEETSLGAYSNESMLAVQGKIFLFNKQGVWAVAAGGACAEVSENIRGLFDNFSNTGSFEEESLFDIDSYPTYADPITSNQFVKVRVDETRKLITFIIRTSEGLGNCLVLNLNNGEFYTWSDFGYEQGSPNFQDLCFINGEFYSTRNGVFDLSQVATLTKELKGYYTYASSIPNPPQLVTTWFTAGEPSLEKKLNQVKFFGLFVSSTVAISHFLDWDASTEISDGNYAPLGTKLYSHKVRLQPANFLAVSISLKFTSMTVVTNSCLFEGLEIEFQPLQENMKR